MSGPHRIDVHHLGLTHIDNDNGIAGREAAPQLTNLDPYRRILARTT
jgi:hypothetical protein